MHRGESGEAVRVGRGVVGRGMGAGGGGLYIAQYLGINIIPANIDFTANYLSMYIAICPTCFFIHHSVPKHKGRLDNTVLRGAIVNRICCTHKNLHISLFFLTNVWSYLLWSPVKIL